MTTNIKTLVLGALLTAVPLCAWADWIPFITNYGKNDYGNGASTWNIVQRGNWTYFANQSGLLQFDGISWTRFPLNNRSEVRGVGVFADKRRIYVGGENEYGYFEVGSNGALDYHCLSDSVNKKLGQLGNIFNIHESNGVQYFRGDNYVLMAVGDKYTLLKSPEKMFASTILNDVLYVTTGTGVRTLMGHQFVPVEGCEQIDGKRCSQIHPYRGGLIIATQTDGLFYWDGHAVSPVRTSVDAQLSRAVICCCSVKDDMIAIGTIHNGLYIINQKTGTTENFNESTGLQNNTVLSVSFDVHNNVWCGLSYGIDYIQLNAPFSYLYRSPQSYGIGYSSLLKDGMLYLGTDRGLYYAHYPVSFANGKPDIMPIEGTSGPAWSLFQADGELFCLHDKGLFLVKGATATRVTNVSGVWSCQQVNGQPDRMLVGAYDGIFLVGKSNGQWQTAKRIQGIGISGRYFRQMSGHRLKVFDPNTHTAVIYTLDSSLSRVVRQETTQESYHDERADSVNFVFNDWDVTGNILHVDANRYIIPYNKGFVMLNQQKVRDNNIKVTIQSMHITSPRDSLVYASNFCGLKPEPHIRHANNSIRIKFGMPTMLPTSAACYQYRLNGGEWSTCSDLTSKEYSNLREGWYTFEVKARLLDGSTTTDSIRFYVSPPWYYTPIAYVCYALLVALLVWLLVRLERHRLSRVEQHVIEEKEEEVNSMKIEIDKLEKDKMELDLKHKSQEIANLIINVTRKNEMLTEIKDDLRQLATSLTAPESKRQLLLVNNKIDSNIESDEVLKKLEEQFDLMNNRYMTRLRELHPNLTYTERLMCAYLRMNLTTKEIAPLLNISVRGVESVRYRLRKKFNLPREGNLMEYLNNIQ